MSNSTTVQIIAAIFMVFGGIIGIYCVYQDRKKLKEIMKREESKIK